MRLLFTVAGLLLSAGRADAPRTIIDLQPFRQSNSIHVRSQAGRNGTATLINLNPTINAWYLLKITWDGSAEAAYHFENPNSRDAKLLLDEKFPAGLVIAEGSARHTCELFGGALETARASSSIYAPLCDGRIYLRNPVVGHRTSLESATEFLRDHVWGGEKIIALGHTVLGEAHRETGSVRAEHEGPIGPNPAGFPLPARIDSGAANELLSSNNMGIELEHPQPRGLAPGFWYAASGNPGVYVSILRPDLISPQILSSYKTRVNPLDGAEASALCYLIAFDLDRFALGYALGTDHPRLGWSEHMLAKMRDPNLPGPDGIDRIAPLVSNGLKRQPSQHSPADSSANTAPSNTATSR